MSAALLTTASTLACPHGGTVAIVSSNTQVQDASAPLALASDTFTISGCPFQIPVGTGSVPHPCVSVQWTKTNLMCTVNGQATLAQDSIGLCLAADQAPQGPVVVQNTQAIASGA